MEIEHSFSPDDWKQFARNMRFSRPGEFYYYAEDSTSGLADPIKQLPQPVTKSKHVGMVYHLSKWVHDLMFTPDRALRMRGEELCRQSENPNQGPALLRALERGSKSLLFQCKDCGDCSLPESAFLCPESQCAKNQRNGPCGGTREGRCEVDDFGDCIWLRAYERLKQEGKESNLLQHAPVIQNQGLRGTSSWANNWLGRDHATHHGIKNSENQTK
jgi:methylenetetrahydrofolate reductase (NADPH)